jgi:hypothetical protein
MEVAANFGSLQGSALLWSLLVSKMPESDTAENNDDVNVFNDQEVFLRGAWEIPSEPQAFSNFKNIISLRRHWTGISQSVLINGVQQSSDIGLCLSFMIRVTQVLRCDPVS